MRDTLHLFLTNGFVDAYMPGTPRFIHWMGLFFSTDAIASERMNPLKTTAGVFGSINQD